MDRGKNEPVPTNCPGALALKTVPQSKIEARLAVLFVAVHVALVAWGAAVHSPTYDETGYVPAGLYHLTTGNFDLCPVNPPLPRMVAAVPLLALRPTADFANDGALARGEFFATGRRFIDVNGRRAQTLYVAARWACLPFTVLGAYVAYRWASELYGGWAGLTATVLWCVCPNFLGHAQLATPDVPAAAVGLWANWLFWGWLKRPDWAGALLTGVALGAAELTKTTWLVLYGVWPLLWVASEFVRRAEWLGAPGLAGARGVALRGGQLAVTLVLSIYVLNLGYGFEGTGTPLGEFQFRCRALAGDEAADRYQPGNRFADSWLARVPVPLPHAYVTGVDQVRHVLQWGYPSYLRGTWRDHGWWYYYLYGLAVKTPVSTIVLMALAAVGAVVGLGGARPRQKGAWFAEAVMLAPAACVLVLVSSQTGINHHLRYVLPAVPYLYIFASRLAGTRTDENGPSEATAVARTSGWRAPLVRHVAVAVLLAGAAIESLWNSPHCMSFFNVPAGGPANGHAHLVDSNIDWGQDLLYLRDWLDEHPEAQPLNLAFFGNFDPRAFGIEFQLPPRLGDELPDGTTPAAAAAALPPGWYAVSVNFLRGYRIPLSDGTGGTEYPGPEAFTYFQHLTPVARAGYSIYVYHVRPFTHSQGDTARGTGTFFPVE